MNKLTEEMNDLEISKFFLKKKAISALEAGDYYYSHPDKIYPSKRKALIYNYAKKYYEKNKIKYEKYYLEHKEQRKKYLEENKETLRLKKAEYYVKTRKTVKKEKKVRKNLEGHIQCDCGSLVNPNSMRSHVLSAKHLGVNKGEHIKCDCGSLVLPSSLKSHLLTAKHKGVKKEKMERKKVKCTCGVTIYNTSMEHHLTTRLHSDYLRHGYFP